MEGETKVKLDLDNTAFIEKALKSKELIENLGDADNLEGLIKGMAKAGAVVGTLGIALAEVRGIMELVFDAERINAVNAQFDALATNAGLSAESLKQSMMAVVNGKAAEIDVLEASNRAIIELGVSASKLADIMKLAGKATAAGFGGNLLQNFEALNQAIATGQTRGLRHLGIIVDQEQANIKFAHSMGITVDAMSQAERRQALLNAALEAGNKSFAGIDPNIKQATTAWQQLKVAFQEIGESFAILGNKIWGQGVRDGLSFVRDWATGAKTWLKAHLGEGAEAAAAKVELLKNGIQDTRVAIIDMEQEVLRNQRLGIVSQDKVAALESLKKKLADLEAQYKALHKAESGESRTPAAEGSPAPEESGDAAKRQKATLKEQEELQKLNKERIRDELDAAQSIEQIDALLAEKKVETQRNADEQIAKVRSEYEAGNISSTKTRDAMIEQIERAKAAKLVALEHQVRDERKKALDQYVANAHSATDAVAKAFKAGAAKNKAALNDWGQFGKVVFDSFGSNAKKALLDWGAGTKDAAEAAKGFVLGMIADAAEAKGEEMMLSSIFPPNPVGFAAGGGLVALAGFLRSQSNGSATLSAGGGVSASPSDASGIQSGEDFGTRTDEKPTLDQQTLQKKSVNLVIQGSVFDTDATRTRIAEIVREASDATDVKIQSVNGGF